MNMNLNLNPLRGAINRVRGFAANSTMFESCCFIVGADADLMHDVPRSERNAMLLQAFAFVLFVVYYMGVWAHVGFEYAAGYVGIPAGLIVAALMLFFDQSIIASDWSLKGVLAQAGDARNSYQRILARVCIALVLCLITALSFITLYFSGEIDAHTRESVAKKNAVYVAQMESQKADAKNRITAPVQAQLGALSAQLAQATAATANRENAALAASQRANNAAIEASREKFGDQKGYKKGEGPNYKEATRQQEAADKLAASAASQVSSFNARADVLKTQLDEKRAELKLANTALIAEEQRLTEQTRSDPRWNVVDKGFLTRMVGLLALMNDPVKGGVVITTFVITFAALLILDLLPILSKQFAPASIYTVRLIARAKASAMQIDLELQQEYARLQANHAQQLSQIAQTVNAMPAMSAMSLER
jgi:Domain of unknown function (DUF4407)